MTRMTSPHHAGEVQYCYAAAVPIRPCPNCQHLTPRSLDTEWANVYTYRCEPCGHIWQILKDRPEDGATILSEG